MRPRRLAVVASAALAATAFANGANADALSWEYWTTPSALATVDPSDSVLERSSHCLDGCRYDRSNRGVEPPATNPYPERWLYSDVNEATIFDERSPGALTRFWLTMGDGLSRCIDPAIHVRFYFDGATTPALDVPLAQLFDGTLAPFSAPLVGNRASSSGGYVSDFPIAYAQSLRVALTHANDTSPNPCTGDGSRLLWFQLTHHRLPTDANVASFVPGQDVPALRTFLAHAGDDPWNGMLAPTTASSTLGPGATLALANRVGPEWLRGIRLHLPRSAYTALRLRLTFDGATTVDAPLADFFATSANAALAARGALVGEDASGWLYAWFPMPYRQTANVELVADATLSSAVSIDSALAFDSSPIALDALTFGTTLTDACTAHGDGTRYDATGTGRVVGLAARYHTTDPATRAYLEGDERVYVDGAVAPSWYGTGVEDFFDGGFYFDHGPFARALAGATELDPDGSGTTAAYRLMLGDSPTYGSALRFAQEAGLSPSQPVTTCARTIVYRYAGAQPARVPYGAFEIGDGAAAAAHSYVVPASASCLAHNSAFEDEPSTSRNAIACRYASGASVFRFRLPVGAGHLRLRRTFEVGVGIPGTDVGSVGADVFVGGLRVGAFSPAAANPSRIWTQQEIPLAAAAAAGASIDISVVPEFGANGNSGFSESAWELRGDFVDSIFVDGFE